MPDVSLLFNILAKDQTGGALGSASGKMDKFKGAVDKASIGIVGGLAAAAGPMINLSQRITELDAKSKTVFGKAEATVQKWAEANKTALGMTSRETVALATNMGDLLKPMGFTSKEAAKQSTKMLDLSGALSSWSGGQKSAAEVSDLLTDAMLGETDGLKALGIAISADDVKARLAKKGQDELKGARLAQATALATQALILEKSTDAQERWKNGAREAAEAQNASKVAMNEAKEALAVALTPAIQKGTKMLAGMAKWVGENEDKVKVMATVIAGAAAVIVTLSVGMKIAAAVVKIWAGAWRLLATVMWANPIFIIAGIIIAIGVALVVAYKKSETFRKVVNAAFEGVKTFVINALQVLSGTILGFWSMMINGAAKAFGWVPGIGDKLKGAAREFDQFKNSVQQKLKDLEGPHLIKVDVAAAAAEAKLDRLQAKLSRTSRARGGAQIATGTHGGITARASGGPVSRGGTYLVGEEGPEVVTFGHNGFVHPNKGKSGKGSTGGGGQMLDLTINLYEDDGSLKKKVRKIVRLDGGGSVQVAFGGR